MTCTNCGGDGYAHVCDNLYEPCAECGGSGDTGACTCTERVSHEIPAPCPVHWPDGVVKLMEAAASKANAEGVPMLSREQFEAVEKVALDLVKGEYPSSFEFGWDEAIAAVLHAIQSQLVMKVEVAPTATATGTIEGLGRRVGEG